jgi:GntR family transcriptional regulator/MocR family aminotransferase
MPALDLLIELNRNRGERLHTQLEAQLRAAIRSGRLPAKTSLPTTRTLATQLGTSRGVVVEAYDQLKAEGYLEAQRGVGTRVAATAHVSETERSAHPSPPVPRYDFHPGHPDLSRFPRAAWSRSLRAALRSAPHSAMGYGDMRGASALRDSLASYLGRVRSTVANSERILIATGHTQAVALVLRALQREGARRIALEDPGFVLHRMLVANLGLEAVPVPVDEHGIDTARLHEVDVDAAIVSPAHQFPTGAVLASQRRSELIAWSESRAALLIEDDYDAEYRYDRQPIGALQGLAPERVVYVGTASKTLAPALRLAWAILPRRLVGALMGEKALDDGGTATLDQLALAHFLDAGELDRHLRRMRPRYQLRREALGGAIERHMPDTSLHGISAGLHALIHLPDGEDELGLLAAAHAQGIFVHGLSSARFDPRNGPPGLVLGYANLAPSSIEQGIRCLAEIRAR